MKTLHLLFKAAFASMLIVMAICSATPAQGVAQLEAPPRPKIIRKSGGALQGSATRRVEPAYPPQAKAENISGAVIVEVTINEEGDVMSARAVSGHPMLKDAAVAAAREWKFTPTKLSGEPVKVIGTVTFNFITQEGATELEEFKEAVRANPNSAEAHFKLAQAYAKMNRNTEALDAFKQATRVNPEYAEAYYHMGLLYFHRLCHCADALEPFKQAIRIKPDYEEAHVHLGLAYSGLRRNDEAVEALKQALQLNPGSYKILTALGQIYVELTRHADAIETLKQAIEIKPDYPPAHHNLGWTYSKQGRFAEAIAEYTQATNLFPDYALAYHNLGWAYYNSRRYEDALEAYNKALRIKPVYNQLYKVHREMGMSYMALNDHAKAVEAFRQSVAIKHDYADARLGLGRALLLVGDKDAALAEYKILKEANSSLAEALLREINK
jgi:TonB family protein